MTPRGRRVSEELMQSGVRVVLLETWPQQRFAATPPSEACVGSSLRQKNRSHRRTGARRRILIINNKDTWGRRSKGYIALGVSFFLKVRIKDIIIITLVRQLSGEQPWSLVDVDDVAEVLVLVFGGVDGLHEAHTE